MDIVSADHCAHIGQRPIGDFAAVGECGQVCFCICVIVQFQRSRHNGHCFLSRDWRIWSHGRSRPTVVSTHLDGERDILVIPLVLGHVLVLRNICRFIAAKRTVDDPSHLRTGHRAIRVDDGTGFAVKQSVIHGCAHGFSISWKNRRLLCKRGHLSGHSGRSIPLCRSERDILWIPVGGLC